MILERPFGRNLASAREIATNIEDKFYEDQIYRIDHYLGKDTIQNLLVLRFANLFFDPLWKRENIHCVEITFQEPYGVTGFGDYFDRYGIVRYVCV